MHYTAHHFAIDVGTLDFKPGCGGLIFFVDHQPVPGEIVRAASVRLLDGTPAVEFSPIICGTCGADPKTLSSTLIKVGDLTDYFAAVDQALQADG